MFGLAGHDTTDAGMDLISLWPVYLAFYNLRAKYQNRQGDKECEYLGTRISEGQILRACELDCLFVPAIDLT